MNILFALLKQNKYIEVVLNNEKSLCNYYIRCTCMESLLKRLLHCINLFRIVPLYCRPIIIFF